MSDLVEMTQPSHTQADEPPAFVVGQDADGHWLAIETHGLGGGMFRNRDEALHYAAFETEHRPDAVRLSEALVELKL